MKYIDAEKLLAEIERRKQIHKSNIDNGFPDEVNKITEDDNILSFITSLQQEQSEVDLEKEIDDYLYPIQAWELKEEPFTSLEKCARHFAEWGAIHFNTRKEE